ncbi:type II toxin-antitoxin system VapC family toxin [Microbacterium sp.]|uniref:type II toxin-antitoxin system VapC family toxin n=1 Tax=Microbacterium sp. TaxID=51671 RepID=UPI003C78624A
MIVVDASAIVELITDEGGASARVAAELDADAEWACPEHALLEAASALRGLWLGGRSSRSEFEARIDVLTRLHVHPVPTGPLLARIGELAANATTYDAAYLAAAERLGIPLVTIDHKLTGVPGIRAEIRVIG